MGPRPLRSAEYLAGLPQLRLKELRQVMVANNLWGSTWRLFSACLCTGAPFIVEHPAAPMEPEAPSMWRIPTVAWLRRFNGVQAPTIFQGYYGALSPKPTTFMICNARCNAMQVLREARTRTTLPEALKMGRQEDGAFATAPLKEYPPGLTAALLQVMRRSITQSSHAGTDGQDAFHMCPELAALDAKLEGQGTQRMGPDYDPQALERAERLRERRHLDGRQRQ